MNPEIFPLAKHERSKLMEPKSLLARPVSRKCFAGARRDAKPSRKALLKKLAFVLVVSRDAPPKPAPAPAPAPAIAAELAAIAGWPTFG